MTTEKIRGNHIKHQLLIQHQLNMKDFAEKYQFPYAAVGYVVRGINRGNYGQGKLIADKLTELIGSLTPPDSDQQAA